MTLRFRVRVPMTPAPFGRWWPLPTASFAYFLLSQDNVHYEMLPAAIDLHLGRIVTIHRGKGRDGDAGAAL